MRNTKPKAYLEKVRCGWFMFEPLYMWVALDRWGHSVARGKTRKDCERECRSAGYVPETY